MGMDPVNEADGMILDVDAILAEYHHRQMMERLVGPAVSLLVHVILVVCAAFFLQPRIRQEPEEFEFTIEEMQIKELEPPEIVEFEELEAFADEVVPTVEKPDVPQDTADVVTDDIEVDLPQTDDAMDFSSVLDVRSTDTPLKLPGLYGGRSNAGRRSMMQKYGGSSQTELAVLKALRWLKQTQNPDGSWSQSQPDAMGGLGLLTFLAHGETPSSEEFGLTVQKAMKYLADRMMAVDADDTPYLDRAYTSGIVTYALSEAYGLTKIPFLKPPMERGLTFIVEGQQASGGFDYRYSKASRWDLSVSGWQIQAMKAGYVAGADAEGLLDAMEKSIHFIKKVTYDDGRFGYSSPGRGSMGIQGVGTLCLQLLGEGHSQEARRGADTIHGDEKVVWDNSKKYSTHNTPVYNWYYETQAMFHSGRSRWRRWNETFTEVVLENQKADGHWDSPGMLTWVERNSGTGKQVKRSKPEYDPWYATTLCCLSLQVYYRYLPTYKMPKTMVKEEKSVLEIIDEDLGIELN